MDQAGTLFLLHMGASIPCRIVELSLAGCRLRTENDARVGVDVRAEVGFQLHGLSFRACGVTEWTPERHGIGFRFLEMSTRRRGELADLLAELQAEADAKAREQSDSNAEEPRESAQPLAGNPAQDRSNRPKSCTAEAERPVPQPGVQPMPFLVPRDGTRPAAQVEAEPNGPAPVLARRDRREALRHPVDSTASIFLVDVGSRVHGRIVDVSLGGCRIRSEKRFPVGIYRRVEVEFTLDGLPFRLPGVVQSLHDPFTVGIRLLGLSERKREQLTALIEELEEARIAESGCTEEPRQSMV